MAARRMALQWERMYSGLSWINFRRFSSSRTTSQLSFPESVLTLRFLREPLRSNTYRGHVTANDTTGICRFYWLRMLLFDQNEPSGDSGLLNCGTQHTWLSWLFTSVCFARLHWHPNMTVPQTTVASISENSWNLLFILPLISLNTLH